MVEEEGRSCDCEDGGCDCQAWEPEAKWSACGLLLGEYDWFGFRCDGCLERSAAGWTHGKVLENAAAFAIQQSIFGERGELIRVGVRIGLLA